MIVAASYGFIKGEISILCRNFKKWKLGWVVLLFGFLNFYFIGWLFWGGYFLFSEHFSILTGSAADLSLCG